MSKKLRFSFAKVCVSAVSTIGNNKSWILINPLVGCVSFLDSEEIRLNKPIGVEEFRFESSIAFQLLLDTVHLTHRWKRHSKRWCGNLWFSSQLLICEFFLMVISLLEEAFFCPSLSQFNSLLCSHKSRGSKPLRRDIKVFVPALFTSEIVKGGFVRHTVVSTIVKN